MPLASLALLAVLTSAALLAITVRSYLRAREELDEVSRRERRYRSWAHERRRFLATRSSLAEAAQLGSSITRAPGRLIRRVSPPGTDESNPR